MSSPEIDLTLPGLVHDLNNVFQTLTEAADLLSADSRWAELAGAIQRCVERGRSIAAGIESTEDTAAPLDTILNHAVSFVQDSMVGGGGPRIAFECDLEPGIELRRNWAWERVLINLFSNAARAMPNGGVIFVHAARRAGQIEIVVRDQGPGIAPEILDTVFQPYVSTSGGGLGLHIVETIVQQDHGSVKAANRAGGAEFTITVPEQPQIRSALA